MSPDQIVILAAYLIFWQAYKLRHKFSGLGHFALILSLAATLANSSAARLSDASAPGPLTGQYYDLAEHLLVLSSVVGLYVFRLAVEGCTLRDRRIQLTLTGGVIVALGLGAGAYHAITDGPLLAFSVESYRDPAGFLFSVGSGMYYGIVMGLVAAWMWRYVRDKDIAFRRGIRIASIGIYAIAALSIIRAVPVAIVFVGGGNITPPSILLGIVTAASFPLVFIGLSYPLLVSRWHAYRAWRQRRKLSNDMRTVWRLCQTVFPEIVLRPTSTSQRILYTLWNPGELQRLSTESFDGLTRLLVQTVPVATDAGRAAAESLRHGVARYDATHDVPVREVIAPSTPAPADGAPVEGVPTRPDHDNGIDMLVGLAHTLRQSAADQPHRMRT